MSTPGLTPRPWLVVLLRLCLALGLVGEVPHSEAAEPSTQQKLFLAARNRQIDLRSAQEELRRAQQLFADGLISSIEVEKARTISEKAQLAYQEALLDLLNIQPRLTIREVVKYQGPQGEKFVRLAVENRASGLQASDLEVLRGFEESVRLPQALVSRRMIDVFISLHDTGAASAGNPAPMRGATVALPYELYLPQIAYGERKTFVFRLLRDVSSVMVRTSFAGRTEETDLHLLNAESGQIANLTSTQASQEADLGSEAIYDLRLTRASVAEQRLLLFVLGLPRQIDFKFVDPVTGARLSQIDLAAGVTERSLSLGVFLPDRADEQVQLDRPLEFLAVVSPGGLDLSRQLSAADVAVQGAGVLRLQLIPRGVGRIEISAVSLFSELRVDEVLRTNVVIKNTGSRRVESTKIAGDPPLGWRVDAQPATISTLDPGEERSVGLTIRPPDNAGVGDYEVVLKAESMAFNRPVRSQEKIYRISIKPRSRILVSAALLTILLAFMVAVVIVGVRVARR